MPKSAFCKTTVLSAFVALLLAQSCGDQAGPADPDALANMSQWIEAMSLSGNSFEAAQLPKWPEGFAVNQRSQVEFFQLQAILEPLDAEGRTISATPIGLVTQMDRLALRPERQNNSSLSEWSYDALVRSSVVVDAVNSAADISTAYGSDLLSEDPIDTLAGITRDPWVERAALGLGGSNEQALWVSSDSLEISLPGSSGRTFTETSSLCRRQYQWVSTLSLEKSIEVQLSIDKCPIAQLLGPIVSWQQTADVSANLVSTDQQEVTRSIPMRGVAWLRHSWGSLPVAAGAVLLDTLQIRLDGGLWLNISRSKRRSGSGPRTITATLQSDELSETSLDVLWEDSDRQKLASSGTAYPESISLLSADNNIALKVVVMNRLAETEDVSGRRLHVPVLVSGSHTGAGFLSFNAIPSKPVMIGSQ